MYRIIFYKIPFMRGGYRVPAVPFGTKPLSSMGGYKITEQITDMAFSETQREIILNNLIATACDNGKANYMYIAWTTSQTIGDYTTDTRPAYYWIDDLQFLGVPDDTESPAAVITISPDVWLTDFFSNTPTVRGRLAQSTINMRATPKSPIISPVWRTGSLTMSNADTSPDAGNVYVIATYSSNEGDILAFISAKATLSVAELFTQIMGGAVRVHQVITIEESTQEKDFNVSCVRMYIVPATFLSTVDGHSLTTEGNESEFSYSVVDENGATISVYQFNFMGLTGSKLRHVYDVPGTSTTFVGVNAKSWIATPARFIEVPQGLMGMEYPVPGEPSQYEYPYLASVYVSGANVGEDGFKIIFMVGSELIDVSDDFQVDFAVNDAAVQQAQRKNLVALQGISSVIGAAGGAIGGLASGNYFGAVQAIAGGVSQFAQLSAARGTPAQIKGSGGALGFARMTGAFILKCAMGKKENGGEISDIESEFGWNYDNSPFVTYLNGSIALNNYYRFDIVVVENVTGGTSAQEEIANALTQGVRFIQL